jgi:membrane protein
MAFDPLSLNHYRQKIQHLAARLLWDKNLAAAPWWRRLLVRSAQIIFALGRDITEGQLSLRAMSLVYSTVLGFIPTLALIFAVLKSLGVHNVMEGALHDLFEILGERRELVVSQIIDFVDNIQVGVIGITSMGLLIYLVLDMMRKIESSFNFIWGVSRGRSWSNRVSEYLFAVIVSPLLIFLSISITSSVNTVFFANMLERLAFGGALINFFAFLFPLLFMSLAFAFAYSFLPNTKVRFSSALIGGIVTTVVWKLMGAFFGGFLISAARESIYLAFATVLALMIFAYVGWLVVLLGSDIAYYHQHPGKARIGRKPVALSITQQEQLTLAVAALIIHRFKNKLHPLSQDEIATQLGTSPSTTEQALNHLVGTGLLASTAEEPPTYLPTGSIEDCTMLEIWRSLRESQPADLHENLDLPEYRLARDFLSQLDQAAAEKLAARKFVDSA